nr:hypothetical protein [Enterobacter roggenkampii]
MAPPIAVNDPKKTTPSAIQTALPFKDSVAAKAGAAAASPPKPATDSSRRNKNHQQELLNIQRTGALSVAKLDKNAQQSNRQSEASAPFIRYERQADAFIDDLAISNTPIATLLAVYHYAIFHSLHRAGMTDPAARVTGETYTWRMSYTLKWMANRAQTPVDESVHASFQRLKVVDPHGKERTQLSLYAHFCEVAPEVHKGNLVATRILDGLKLSHKSSEFADAEAKDILISELDRNYVQNAIRKDLDPAVRALFDSNVSPTSYRLIEPARARAARYAADIVEMPLLTDTGMQGLFGFDTAQFAKVQSALFGYVDVTHQLAMAHHITSETYNGGEPSAQALEWISLRLPTEKFRELISKIADVEMSVVGAFVEAFSYHPGEPACIRRGGEGFTPPFVELDGFTILSSDLVLSFCQPRNAIVSLAKRDLKTFNDLVSKDLEPVLLAEVRDALGAAGGEVVRTEYKYKGGELDLIVVNASTQAVLIGEAKAPVPVQGSRATKNLAARMQEGLQQLAKFQSLPLTQQIAIIEGATGIKLTNPSIRYLLIGRSCFGAPEAWTSKNVTPASLPLIRLAATQILTEGQSIAAGLAPRIAQITEEFIEAANPVWKHATIRLAGKRLSTPQLIYDREAVRDWTLKSHN